jgi:Na+-exporting ATPase
LTGIAIIPESLIAVLTITMVVGMTQMRKRRVVVRQLSALEALGGVTNICSDKTGTLTQGQMVTRKAWIPGVGIYSVNKSDDASNPTRGFITLNDAPASKTEAEEQQEKKRIEMDQARSAAGLRFDIPAERQQKDTQNEKTQDDENLEAGSTPEVVPELESFLFSSSLCNLATVRHDANSGNWQTMGDPTEIALQVFAHRFAYGKKTLEAEHGWKEIAEYPFDSTVKRMSVIYRKGEEKPIIYTKGAVERVVDLCTSVGLGQHQKEMTPETKDKVLEQMGFLADQGLRVLAMAQKSTPEGYQSGDELPRDEVEKDLTLLGLAGLYDPPRLETKDAVKGKLSKILAGDISLTACRMYYGGNPCPHADRRPPLYGDCYCQGSWHHTKGYWVTFRG